VTLIVVQVRGGNCFLSTSGDLTIRRHKADFIAHTQPDHRTSFIIFLHLQRSMASSLLTILLDNLSPGPGWSSSWSWTLNFICHTFLHPIIIVFLQHMPIPTQPVLLQNCRIATNIFTADPTSPSYSFLPHLLTFSTYHNLGFIHIDSHAFTLHVIHTNTMSSIPSLFLSSLLGSCLLA